MQERIELPRLVVVGAGDVGGRVAAQWVQRGGHAVGLTRSTARHDDLRARGVQPSCDAPKTVVRPDDVVVLSVAGSAALEAVATELSATSCARVVMTSSTGFHGAVDGVAHPDDEPGLTERSRAAHRAEIAVRALPCTVVVLRLAGLYREGRGPLAALLRRGFAPVGPADRALPLVHVNDAATAVLAALTHPSPRPTVLVVSAPVPTRLAFYELACARHGLPAPQGWPLLGRPPGEYDTVGLSELLPNPEFSDWTEATRA